MRDQLALVSTTFKAHPALQEALSNPGVPAGNKKAIAAEVFRDLQPPLPRLIEMLIESARIELVHDIALRYRDEWNEKNNVHSATVTTVLALDEGESDRVRKAIEAAVSGTVEMELRTDASLVGGLRVEVDGHLFDGTVKARLKALRQHLL